MTDPNSEKPFEFGNDDAFDVPTCLGEGAENVPALGWPLIAKSYMRRRLEIHLHFRLVEPEVAEYCVVLKGLEEVNLGALNDARVHNEWAVCAPLAPAVGNARVHGPTTPKLWCRSTRASSLRRKRGCPFGSLIL